LIRGDDEPQLSAVNNATNLQVGVQRFPQLLKVVVRNGRRIGLSSRHSIS
jgi:hypothetical protein